MNQIWTTVLLAALITNSITKALSQPITVHQVDQLVQRNRTLFHIPGVALTIIKDGQLVLSKGYGLISLRTKQVVTPQTFLVLLLTPKPSQRPPWPY